jgi:cAMP-dependent protein kinase regulator
LEIGDHFYIIDEGRFEVRIVPDGNKKDTDGTWGNPVHEYEGSVAKHTHPCFGELALMYSAPRSASIIAQMDDHLWALHHSAFRQVLAQSQDAQQELKKSIAKMPAFQKLDSRGIDKLQQLWTRPRLGVEKISLSKERVLLVSLYCPPVNVV